MSLSELGASWFGGAPNERGALVFSSSLCSERRRTRSADTAITLLKLACADQCDLLDER